MLLKRIKLVITGTVQGVGFRPTVFRYAKQHSLTGNVNNTVSGVFIEVQGKEEDLAGFVSILKDSPPPAAIITSTVVTDLSVVSDENDFIIIKSAGGGEKDADISPDLATCPDCIADIKDPKNRRHNYPFTNCTNCGPRFTIIHDRPYDRHLTTMHEFKMCSECQAEYDDPMNRRFHAQPNACPVCGPQLSIFDINGVKESTTPIDDISKLLKAGKLLAIKGLGGFNISCDPTRMDSIARLRASKRRPNKAFALMMRDLKLVKQYCHVSDQEEDILLSQRAPIVLLRKKSSELDHISPDNNYLGVMLAYTPMHHLIMQSTSLLLMTSANRADEPIAIFDSEIETLIRDEIVDVALTNNRVIAHRCDDSIVQLISGNLQIIRRARGYTPTPIDTQPAKNTTLSLGANLKNTFSIRKQKKTYISQHIGDLMDFRNYKYQEDQISDFKNLLDVTPENTICDEHPGYENYSDDHRKVYHHHAHILSVMGEHNLLGKETLGLSCDGTGFGTDGKIWGWEFLKVSQDHTQFERVAHLRYFQLPGGEKAITEVDRIAISLTRNLEINSLKTVNSGRVETIKRLLKSNINCPETSSMGRLFDGVSALIGLASTCEYEARAAILLQKTAEDFVGEVKHRYPVSVEKSSKPFIIDYEPMIESIIGDLEDGVSQPEMAYKFHLWIVDSIDCILKELTPETFVFSGGCFQNRLLADMFYDLLSLENRQFFTNCKVPTNDAGISFGQSTCEFIQ